jgi:hypothetical protein
VRAGSTSSSISNRSGASGQSDDGKPARAASTIFTLKVQSARAAAASETFDHRQAEPARSWRHRHIKTRRVSSAGRLCVPVEDRHGFAGADAERDIDGPLVTITSRPMAGCRLNNFRNKVLSTDRVTGAPEQRGLHFQITPDHKVSQCAIRANEDRNSAKFGGGASARLRRGAGGRDGFVETMREPWRSTTSSVIEFHAR